MKSFLQGAVAAIIIALVAGVVLNATSVPSSQKFATSNARL